MRRWFYRKIRVFSLVCRFRFDYVQKSLCHQHTLSISIFHRQFLFFVCLNIDWCTLLDIRSSQWIANNLKNRFVWRLTTFSELDSCDRWSWFEFWRFCITTLFNECISWEFSIFSKFFVEKCDWFYRRFFFDSEKLSLVFSYLIRQILLRDFVWFWCCRLLVVWIEKQIDVCQWFRLMLWRVVASIFSWIICNSCSLWIEIYNFSNHFAFLCFCTEWLAFRLFNRSINCLRFEMRKKMLWNFALCSSFYVDFSNQKYVLANFY